MKIFFLFALLFFVSCCTTIPNIPKDRAKPFKQDTTKIVQDDSTFIALCVSGGGSRAMAFGYYVIKYLDSIKYKGKNSIVDEIDMASGVSGGSFVVAALPIYRHNWNEFNRVAVTADIEWSLLWRVLLPWHWNRSRSDIAADYYDSYIFKGKRFGELSFYPYLQINSTLLAEATHFVFDSTTFGFINSDWNSVRVADAVNSSSCFPGAFNPRTFQNYAAVVPDSILMKDSKYKMAVANSTMDIDQYSYMRYRRYLNSGLGKYLHVSDGGESGNTGVEAVLNEMQTSGRINVVINSGKLKRLIIIVADAGTNKMSRIGLEKEPPKTLDVLLTTLNAAMDGVDNQRIKVVKDRLSILWQFAQGEGPLDPLRNMEEPYFIEINTRNLTGLLDKQFDNLPTNFYLNAGQLETVRLAVNYLMDNNADLKRLKNVLKGK